MSNDFDPDDVKTGPIRGFNPGHETPGGDAAVVDKTAEIIDELREEIREQIQQEFRQERKPHGEKTPGGSTADDPESGR
ncbi:hypothetical protein E0H73_39680 [Kribbella pittospori]|uniref:Uncharacterized protein n=1 Tax=Kribbella pittospori TaxID=722689 RepID=A0A4V6N4P5_9ACTN|nr:hypothetical protein [Kribbella pittospori]TCC54272.1 hypothetical protein E0H73_39680 [Kribbella pittospori]